MILRMMFSPRSTPTRRIAHRAWTAAFALAVIAAGDAGAQSAVQGVPNAMQGFSQNRDQPIQIEAAALEMRDKKKEATFSGNVKVVQGDTTMTSKTLVVFYDSTAAPAAAPAANSKAAAKSAPIQCLPNAPHGWPRPISSPAWSASFRNCRASWDAITRFLMARPPSWPLLLNNTTVRVLPAMRYLRTRSRLPLLWPINWRL